MKSRRMLPLVELVLMLLVFSLAASLTLRAFALSDRISNNSEMLDGAVIASENAAELVSYYRGDIGALVENIGGSEINGAWVTHYTADWVIADIDCGYTVEAGIIREGRLGIAEITVSDNDENIIFNLKSSWQEVSP